MEPSDQETVIIGAYPTIPFVVYGVKVGFNPDPTSGDAWAELVGMQAKLTDVEPTDAKQVQALAADLKRILSEFVIDNKDGWDQATFGFNTLAIVLAKYVEKVTDGIPTVP